MVEVTKISSKGQIVIPLEIREKMDLEEGTPILISENDDSICMKKIEIPKIKSWNEVTKPFRKAAKQAGFTKDDLDRLMEESKLK